MSEFDRSDVLQSVRNIRKYQLDSATGKCELSCRQCSIKHPERNCVKKIGRNYRNIQRLCHVVNIYYYVPGMLPNEISI